MESSEYADTKVGLRGPFPRRHGLVPVNNLPWWQKTGPKEKAALSSGSYDVLAGECPHGDVRKIVRAWSRLRRLNMLGWEQRPNPSGLELKQAL